MTKFQKVCGYRCKNARKIVRKALKKAVSRKNRREGKKLEDGVVYRLNERDVI